MQHPDQEHEGWLREQEAKRAEVAARHRAQTTYVTHAHLEQVLEMVGREVAKHVAKLEERITTLEARPELKHVGTWRSGVRYEERNLVTHDGSVFMCTASTDAATPGKSPNWRLIVKRGKDAAK